MTRPPLHKPTYQKVRVPRRTAALPELSQFNKRPELREGGLKGGAQELGYFRGRKDEQKPLTVPEAARGKEKRAQTKAMRPGGPFAGGRYCAIAAATIANTSKRPALKAPYTYSSASPLKKQKWGWGRQGGKRGWSEGA